MTDVLDRLKTALSDRYAIEREIGSGGMATVYHAQDLKHERQVAVKVLRPELAAALGPERFLQEIKIAANLHHPHILPLYDSGEADGFLYYVMPYVEGEALRDRLEREKQLAIDDALQVAREVADALSYAHAHGVIHRDIKPENILLESGHAVVADFGIARAVDAAGGERLTETGIAIGTPTYMSPEQAGGEKNLDGRSDLYSLGCVLHEMLAGQPPFTGPTVESLVHQHLSAEPPNVTAIRPSVPGWIAAALERSLAKTPADRFNPVAQFGEAISPRASVTAADSRPLPAASERRRWLVPGVLAAALVVVITVALVRMMASGPITITTANALRVTNDPGLEFQPAISPDGMEVAYVVGPIGAPSIRVRAVTDAGSGGESRLAAGVDRSHWYPTWMPDGLALRFWDCENRYGVSPGCGWKQTGTRGGSVRNVSVPRLSSRYAWSVDGTHVAFAVGRDSIFAYSGDGAPELLGVHAMDPWNPHSLVWSPDGRFVAYVNGNPWWRTSANVATSSIWILSTSGGEPVAVTDEEHLNVSPQWLPDSRHLLFASDQGGLREVYVVAVGPAGPRGDPQKVPGLIDPHSISVSEDGRRLAYAKFTVVQNIWSTPIRQSGSVSIRDAVPITRGNQVVESHDLSPDGEWIVFDSDISGEFNLYKQRVDGGDQELVADIPGVEYAPRWSPDGTELAFHSGSGHGGVFVVSESGGGLQQLTDTWSFNPAWSPDGLVISLMSDGSGELAAGTWTVSRDGVGTSWSEPVKVSDSRGCFWAQDASSLFCRASNGFIRVSTDGEELFRLPLPEGMGASWYRLSPDGARIYFRSNFGGSPGVWWIPVDGGQPTKVVAYDDPSLTIMGGHTVGAEHLYHTIATYESDIWVVDLEW